MPEGNQPPLQAIAMHGWGRDARTWEPWQGATNGVDYLVSNLERAGRGETADLQPLWDRAEV